MSAAPSLHPQRFAGKRAVVTGAGSGIGRATAQQLAREGAEVVGFDLHEVPLRETFAIIAGDRAPLASKSAPYSSDPVALAGGRAVTVDVTSEEALAALAEAQPVDVLVNAAAVLRRHAALEHPLGDWRRTLDVNLKGPLRLSRELARWHVQRGTRAAIVNVGSIESFTALPGHAAYTASKTALLMLTRAFALELAPHGIRVNCLAPGVTETEMNAALRADPEQAELLRAQIPLGRFATPAEQAAGVCFLASEEAAYVTGATLPVDGGWLTR
jgi:meso-butanediol dehydrogenase / (S,S)-butanediol dehydrogenase / diacetyl reductase